MIISWSQEIPPIMGQSPYLVSGILYANIAHGTTTAGSRHGPSEPIRASRSGDEARVLSDLTRRRIKRCGKSESLGRCPCIQQTWLPAAPDLVSLDT